MTRTCHLCNKEIQVGELIGHMRYKLVIAHQHCLHKKTKTQEADG